MRTRKDKDVSKSIERYLKSVKEKSRQICRIGLITYLSNTLRTHEMLVLRSLWILSRRHQIFHTEIQCLGGSYCLRTSDDHTGGLIYQIHVSLPQAFTRKYINIISLKYT